MTNDPTYMDRKIRRKAEFIVPPNILKEKVGSGGLTDDIIEKAQSLLETHAVEFQPLADIYLDKMQANLAKAQSPQSAISDEEVFASLLYPAMQLKANGGMFHYPLVTKVANHLIRFLEVIEKPDNDVLDIVNAFQSTIRAIVHGGIKGDAGQQGDELLQALIDACTRYFDRHPEGALAAGQQEDHSDQF